jgi:phenylalanyl-tRNA synthetase alpha chain
MHEKGGHGSIGYRYGWSIDEAKTNILRTHTTAVSSRMLYKLANQEGGFQPKKYFSIDRVFRNESLDATHLCEFHQVEGFVADYNLTLGDLIGGASPLYYIAYCAYACMPRLVSSRLVSSHHLISSHPSRLAVIREFFTRMGIENVRFKPAYNPYTEPSMEIFGYSPQLKKWIELGNSGVFRPEMLAPMGMPDGVRVIAWGLGLEVKIYCIQHTHHTTHTPHAHKTLLTFPTPFTQRPTMLKYGIKKIQELFGHRMNIDMINKNPVARYN